MLVLALRVSYAPSPRSYRESIGRGMASEGGGGYLALRKPAARFAGGPCRRARALSPRWGVARGCIAPALLLLA
eukprot:2979827-Pleurochrysis_carterae.AAC.1